LDLGDLLFKDTVLRNVFYWRAFFRRGFLPVDGEYHKAKAFDLLWQR